MRIDELTIPGSQNSELICTSSAITKASKDRVLAMAKCLFDQLDNSRQQSFMFTANNHYSQQPPNTPFSDSIIYAFTRLVTLKSGAQ